MYSGDSRCIERVKSTLEYRLQLIKSDVFMNRRRFETHGRGRVSLRERVRESEWEGRGARVGDRTAADCC